MSRSNQPFNRITQPLRCWVRGPEASSSPYSVVEAVDPEEALVEAFGVMEKNSEGKLAITRITLRPKIEFSEDKLPSAEELDSLQPPPLI